MSGATGNPTRILILGGGFGGVATAQELAKQLRRDPAVEITLVSRDNHFLYVPLLASAAAGSIEALHVVAPIRAMLKGVRFRQEEVLGIDLGRRVVITGTPDTARERELPFDHLVLGLGNVISLAKLPGVAQHGKTLKTLGDAFAIRNHALKMLEMADIETDPVARREMLTFVVAGGGFSGVEMIGELNDLLRAALPQYPSIAADQLRVVLLHSQGRILPEMSAGIADYALKQLRKRQVEVMLNVRLAGATPHEANLQGGAKIPTRTLIVAVGNAPPPVLDALAVGKDRGRIVVDDCMRVPDAPGVWALGDNAIVPNRAAKDGSPSPPTAQYALRQGKRLAKNIAATIRGGQPAPFAFGGLGLLCLVGHGAGVGELPFGIRVKGRLGWFLWRSVYWSKLPTLGRKIQIGAGWLLDPLVPIDTARVNLGRTQTVSEEHHEAGEYIFRQGEPGDSFYLVARGAVEIVREHSSGQHEILARLGEGEYFGETALLTKRPRNASARCSVPTDLISLGRDDFSTLAGTWLQFAESLRATSDQRVESAPLTSFFSRLNVPSDGTPVMATTVGGTMSQVTPAARLVRRDAEGEIALDRDLISIGRSADNNIVIPDQRVSRRHALIQREGEVYWLEDLGGANGTLVNGQRVTERVRLQQADSIAIGPTQYHFMAAPVHPPAPPQPVTFTPPPPVYVAPPPPSPVQQPAAFAPAQPPAVEQESLTSLIRGLDARLPTEGNAQSEPPPQSGPVTRMIHALDAPPAPPDRVLLQATEGPANGHGFEVRQAGGILGRASENAVSIPDEQLSRRHAQIQFGDGAFWISDLGSRNGTFVNETRIVGPQQLRSGDQITVGNTRLLVTLDGR